MLGNFMLFLSSPVFFFQIQLFRYDSFSNTIRLSNTLGPEPDVFVGPDLDQKCLQM